MANNIVELSRTVPVFTILNTEDKAKQLLVLSLNDQTTGHIIGLDMSNNSTTYIYVDSAISKSRSQLMSLLSSVDKRFVKTRKPDGNYEGIIFREEPLNVFPALSITDTTILYEKGFKVLSEDYVIKSLDAAGINHDNLEYKVFKLSNDHRSVKDARAYYNSTISNPTLTEEEQDLVDYIKAGAVKNVALIGPAGTGKTMFVKKIVNALGYTLEQRQNAAGVELDDIVGGIAVNTEDDSSKNFIKKDGLLTNSDQPKSAGLFDEVNMGDVRNVAALNNFLDDSGYYVDINGKKHYRHEDYVFFIAYNPGYESTNILNQAFLDRFSFYTFLDITKDDFMKWIARYDFKNTKFLDILYEAFTKTKSLFSNRNFQSEVTFRGVIRLMDKLVTDLDLGKKITEDRINNIFNTSIINKAPGSEDTTYQYELDELQKESGVWCKDLYLALKEGEVTTIEDGIAEIVNDIVPNYDAMDKDSSKYMPSSKGGLEVGDDGNVTEVPAPVEEEEN